MSRSALFDYPCVYFRPNPCERAIAHPDLLRKIAVRNHAPHSVRAQAGLFQDKRLSAELGYDDRDKFHCGFSLMNARCRAMREKPIDKTARDKAGNPPAAVREMCRAFVAKGLR